MVVKRSMRAGFAGIENELFFNPKTLMVFGDAKAVVDGAGHRGQRPAGTRSRSSRAVVGVDSRASRARAGKIVADRLSRRRASARMSTLPADYPPPFRPSDYVVAPQAAEDERIDVGVLIVGAGPAGLATAVRLGQLLAEDPELAEQLGEVPIAVAEKGKAPGLAPALGRRHAPRAAQGPLPRRAATSDIPHYGEVTRRGRLLHDVRRRRSASPRRRR